METKTHSNAFWADPAKFRTEVPHLAVLLLNNKHSLWKIKHEVAPHGTKIHPTELFWNMWSNAEVTVCADGGANRLFDRSIQVDAQDLVMPHYIKGDLDSLRDDVKEFYAKKGTKILQDSNQDTHDLDKCLELIFELQGKLKEGNGKKFTVVIFGALGGRFDQEMANINALFRWHDHFDQIMLISEETTARLLLPGVRHVIEPNFHFETRTCGLIPIAGTCLKTTTKGLKWNLNDQEMKFGGLISSSNRVDDAHNTVEVLSSHPLIWTTELKQ